MPLKMQPDNVRNIRNTLYTLQLVQYIENERLFN
uniref:Uncharacterized protein n=1 Tax=Anguilla anguilla TaxID=7936 RepID=A0A0E9VC17_ANGAN